MHYHLNSTEEPRHNEGPRDWQNYSLYKWGFVVSRFFSIHFSFTGARKSFVMPRTSLYRGSLNRGSTVLELTFFNSLPGSKIFELKSFLFLQKRHFTGADPRGGGEGVPPPPPHPEMKSTSYSLLKFVYLTGQFLSGATPPKEKKPGSAPALLKLTSTGTC